MVGHTNARVYFVEIEGTLNPGDSVIPHLTEKQRLIEVDQKFLTLDVLENKIPKRMYFELAPYGQVIPHAERLFVNPQNQDFGVTLLGKRDPKVMDRRVWTIDKIIEESSEEQLLRRVEREYKEPEASEKDVENRYEEAGYMRKVSVKIVIDKELRIARCLLELLKSDKALQHLLSEAGLPIDIRHVLF